MTRRALPLNALMDLNPEKKDVVTKLINKFPEAKKYGFLPLSGKKASLTVIIDIKTGETVEISNLNPWPL